MIKVDVLIQEEKWKKYIINPQKYLNNKTNKIGSLIPLIKAEKVVFSVLLAGNRDIKNLNKKFRNKNKTTDVLSFPFYKNVMERNWTMDVNFRHDRLKKNHPAFKKKELKDVYLGDIILNFYKINKKNFKKDFNRLWVHGFLHLLGYKHYKNKDFYKMSKLENQILNKIKNTR